MAIGCNCYQSKEAPVNDLNNPVLLLRRHLVVGGQTQAAGEDIGSDVDSGALYVSICPSSAVPLDCYIRVCPIYRLHMHGLPHYSCYTCYIVNLSSSRKKRIISCFMLISAHFRCNAYFPSKLHGVLQCYPCDISFFSFSRSA